MLLLIIAIVVLLLFGIYYYNRLIRIKNEVDNATGSINAMLKNRYDLIPNLVDTVKTYMTYETDVLNKLTSMRTIALDNRTSDKEKFKIDSQINQSVKQLIVSAENYPDLKASQNFTQLQESWTDVEDRISASRRFYNNAVTEYNIAIKYFPQNIVAGFMNLKPKSIFEITTQETENVKAKDLFNR